ncbi:MAG: DUF2155 domain-containing protein [Henriciella sp.]|uniref:DUF2155 domain-containing protein n=1 Tax=Henriciella sp. TaxID=1968823 RepID=UPI003C75CB34
MRLISLLTASALGLGTLGLPAAAATYTEEQTATLRALDKITGRSTDFEINVGEPVIYGSLKIGLEACFQTPPEEPPESAAFLQIETANAVRMQSMTVPRLASDVEGDERSERSDDETQTLFSGWMFASTPGLNALEHPVYDVWVIRCTERSPVSLSSPEEPAE